MNLFKIKKTSFLRHFQKYFPKMFFLKKWTLRYNLLKTKCNHLQYIVQWVLANIYYCATNTTILIQNVLIALKRFCCTVFPINTQTQTYATIDLFLQTKNLSFLEFHVNRIHIIYCLTFFLLSIVYLRYFYVVTYIGSSLTFIA